MRKPALELHCALVDHNNKRVLIWWVRFKRTGFETAGYSKPWMAIEQATEYMGNRLTRIYT